MRPAPLACLLFLLLPAPGVAQTPLVDVGFTDLTPYGIGAGPVDYVQSIYLRTYKGASGPLTTTRHRVIFPAGVEVPGVVTNGGDLGRSNDNGTLTGTDRIFAIDPALADAYSAGDRGLETNDDEIACVYSPREVFFMGNVSGGVDDVRIIIDYGSSLPSGIAFDVQSTDASVPTWRDLARHPGRRPRRCRLGQRRHRARQQREQDRRVRRRPRLRDPGHPAHVEPGHAARAGGTLQLTALGLPANEFGCFLVGQGTGTLFPVPNSVGRFDVPALIRNSSNVRRFGIDVDTNAIPLTPPIAVQPGETWNFQCWYRDGGSSKYRARANPFPRARGDATTDGGERERDGKGLEMLLLLVFPWPRRQEAAQLDLEACRGLEARQVSDTR
ncbi:MAG: hypothetical protein GY711_18730 [bacterium]|nr:hypothetical protein [bacterium]